MSDATNTTVPEPAADGSYDRPYWPGQWRWVIPGGTPSNPIEVVTRPDGTSIRTSAEPSGSPATTPDCTAQVARAIVP